MQVAVCDDERIMAEILMDELREFPEIESIRSFQSMDLFWQMLDEDRRPDLVFMDIDWKQEENGIQFAEQLYRVSPDTQVIYVTAYNAAYSQDIFLRECNLCGYLAKPVEHQRLALLLEKASRNAAHKTEQNLLIHQKSRTDAIPLRKILYVESKAHQLLIHTETEVFTYYERLETLKKDLPSYFLQCHKSFLVNMNYIRRVDKSAILLKNMDTVPISRSHYTDTRDAYFRYVEEIL